MKILFNIVAFICFIGVIYLSYIPDPSISKLLVWTFFTVFFILLANPSVIQSISFMGSKIELQRVESALDELRSLAKTVSYMILELVQTSNRWGGFNDQQQEKVYSDIQSLLTDLKIPKNEIKSIQENWHTWVEHDYVGYLITHTITHRAVPAERMDEWQNDRETIHKNIQSITTDELRNIFEKYGKSDEQVKKIIDYLEYYKIHKKHKDIQFWNNRQNWFK
ncbi:MAG: hypothetical protein M9899_02340 [Bdellovibrionaceae bacterium]|nr:hypothetical protein [Pseudobdellovibrionaceae bacterium]